MNITIGEILRFIAVLILVIAVICLVLAPVACMFHAVATHNVFAFTGWLLAMILLIALIVVLVNHP